MKKLLLSLFSICVIACSASAQSQDKGRLSLDLTAGVPIGDASHKSYFVVGGALKYNVLIAENVFLTGSAGYTYLHGKNHDVETAKGTIKTAFDIGAIPLKGGLRYYFNESAFFEGQAGAAFFTEGGKGTAFVYAPSLGYTFTGGFEMGIRYESWSKVNYDRYPQKKNDSLGQALIMLSFGF
ncbi:MAG: hypothetical protein EOP47_26035 [Sphingobacteriaceae bacterium]|nr:MAG: hypothetical protein EOP47_26035 [Sphingobacteriaceae bacterium]